MDKEEALMDNMTMTMQSADEEWTSLAQNELKLSLLTLKHVNLVLQLHAVNVVQGIRLENLSDVATEELECVLECTPPALLPMTVPLGRLQPHEHYALQEPDVRLDYCFLKDLSDAVPGSLRVSVRHAGEELLAVERPLMIYSCEQWLGFSMMPELLCAYVTPNLTVISELMRRLAQEKSVLTGSGTELRGYDSGNPQEVLSICMAAYRAVHALGLHYVLPPASFGVPGQRLRLATDVCQGHQGTCIDLTLLFASLLEACRLHPVIMLHHDHAYVGCHLKETNFSALPLTDLQQVRKLVDLGEFTVFETTLVCSEATFAEAEAKSRQTYLRQDDTFEAAIDVYRARLSGIRPLPLARGGGLAEQPPENVVTALRDEQPRCLEPEVDMSELTAGQRLTGRIGRWCQHLLDLSLRNRLLNVKDGKWLVPLLVHDVGELEDILAARESLRLSSLDGLTSASEALRSLRQGEKLSDQDALWPVLKSELKAGRLWSPLEEAELAKRLVGLVRQGRVDMEEGGVNTLFLAIGFLSWKTNEREERCFRAPLLLMPVKMQRLQAGRTIVLSRLDEETVVNETLLELLRSQFKVQVRGLSPLPTDASGVDIPRVLQIFRQTVKDMPGWEVTAEAAVGLFSFGKFVMWTDLANRSQELRHNALVSHLLSGNGDYRDGIEVFPPEEIERHCDPASLFCPLSADASQLTAVLYSALGKSFVLHGPPGTGKSQTITNIIAHNMALGRRVLFVSEKKAALDVVHRRLTAIGLKPFCLELHSSKAGKAEVLAQFGEALKVADQSEPQDWQRLTQELTASRDELNAYVQVLHRPLPNGCTAWQCFDSELEHPDDVPPLNVLPQGLCRMSGEERQQLQRLAADVVQHWQLTNREDLQRFDVVPQQDWSPFLERQLVEAAQTLEPALAQLELAGKELLAEIMPELAPACPAQSHACGQFVEALLACRRSDGSPMALPTGLLEREDWQRQSDFICAYAQRRGQLHELKKQLGNFQVEQLLQVTPDGLERQLTQLRQMFWLWRFFKQRSFLSRMQALCRPGAPPLTLDALADILPRLRQLQSLTEAEKADQARIADVFEHVENLSAEDWQTIAAEQETWCRLCQTLDHLFQGDAEDVEPRMKFGMRLQRKLANPEQTRKLLSCARTFRNVKKALEQACEAGEYLFDDVLKSQKTFAEYRTLLTEFPQAIRGLRDVLRYRHSRQQAVDCGLQQACAALENGTLEERWLTADFDRLYAHALLDELLRSEPALAHFSGLTRQERIKAFCQQDQYYTDITRKLIVAHLVARLPRKRQDDACPEGSELGILKRECEKKARFKPVRQLLGEIPTLAASLKPCFLMSPMSVAQYLPADTARFDLIVFDEASQIPAWDAVGVIARGRQLIVVGDPKQMPPTSFFQKGDVSSEDDFGEDEEESIEDLESILDECHAAGVPPIRLNWHYRSRHESLIAFSNQHYYEGKLMIFPAAQRSEKLGISFRLVEDGLYDRRGTRTNPQEAQALVDFIFGRLSEMPADEWRSVGVVTFSQAQRDLIEDLIDKKRRLHPELESFFADDALEPFFVKNLENVQGDERDVILFSIGYAPDASGRFAMNFGPLNRLGGERRLNVAITRAKEQVVVFSSIHAEQIDLARSSALGVAHLRHFLDYAEHGYSLQQGGGDGEAQMRGKGLADRVADFLTSQGYPVERRSYRGGCVLDPVVPDPERPGEYLLAVVADGPDYAAQLNARDRDHLRDAVLRQMGWNLCHVWSADWALDRYHAEKQLLVALRQAQRNKHQLAKEQQPRSTDKSVPVPETPDEKATEEPETVSLEVVVEPEPASRESYRCWQGGCPDGMEVSDERAHALIRQQIAEILQQESPMYEALLRRRLMRGWGLSRMNRAFADLVSAALPCDCLQTNRGCGNVIWRAGLDPHYYQGCRRPASARDKREIDEIPPEELANAMLEIVHDFGNFGQDALYRETLKFFGLSVLTERARHYLDIALQYLNQSGRLSGDSPGDIA